VPGFTTQGGEELPVTEGGAIDPDGSPVAGLFTGGGGGPGEGVTGGGGGPGEGVTGGGGGPGEAAVTGGGGGAATGGPGGGGPGGGGPGGATG
jgi:hypothetical protein